MQEHGAEHAALCERVRAHYARLVAEGKGLKDAYALEGRDPKGDGQESAQVVASLETTPTAQVRALCDVLDVAWAKQEEEVPA